MAATALGQGGRELAQTGRELAETAESSRFVVSLRNLLRRPARSVMTGAAVAISMALLISMASVSEAIKDTARLSVEESREDLVIAPEQGAMVEGAHAVVANVSLWSEVAFATAAAYHELTAETPELGDKAVYATGIVPEDFWAMAGRTERELYKGGWFKEPRDPFFGNGTYDGRFTGEVLVSKNLVDKYGVTVGGALPLRMVADEAAVGDRLPVWHLRRGDALLPYVNFTVAGSFELDVSGSGFYKELAIVVMHLGEMQAMSGLALENGTGGQAVVTDLANGVSVALTPEAIRAGAVGAVGSRLKAAYPEYADYVYTKAEQLEKQRQETVVAEVFYLAVGSVSLLIGLLFVATIMIVAVMERTREIGMLRALGISKRSIFVQIFVESMVLVLVGALIGIAPGYYGAVWAAGKVSADIGLELVLTFSAPFMLQATALVLAVGSLFAMYPAAVATRMNIVRAITSVR